MSLRAQRAKAATASQVWTFVLVASSFFDCSVKDSHRYFYDLPSDDEESGARPAAVAGMAGAGGGTHVVVGATEPCWIAGCSSGSVCDGVSCVAQPTTCDDGGEPACGVDRRTYASVCAANLAGVGVTPDQRYCSPPAGYFLCVDRFCEEATSFCNAPLEYEERQRTPASDLGCRPLPAACLDEHTCACMYANPPFALDSCCNVAASGEVYFGCTGEVP